MMALRIVSTTRLITRKMLGVIAIVFTACFQPCNAQRAILYWLGVPSPSGQSIATDVSATGLAVVGWTQDNNGAVRAFHWSWATGMRLLGTLDGSVSVAHAVRETGLDSYVVAGSAEDSLGYAHAFRWQHGWNSLRRELNDSRSVAFDIGSKVGAHGDYIFVGWAMYGQLPKAVYWISYRNSAPSANLVYIDTFPDTTSYALAIAEHSQRIVGRIEPLGGNWHAFYSDIRSGDPTIVDIGTLGGCCSAAEDVSANGLVIVGWAHNSNNHVRAFRWSGTMRDLGTLGGNESAAYGVDMSGSLIVGSAQDRDQQWRAVWWINGSIQDLNQLVADQLDEGSRLIEARAISASGAYIVGYGYRAGRYEAFLIAFASRLPGDVNGDLCVNDSDVLSVLFAFGNSGGTEDLNQDGTVDDADLLEVLFNFGNGAGC